MRAARRRDAQRDEQHCADRDQSIADAAKRELRADPDEEKDGGEEDVVLT